VAERVGFVGLGDQGEPMARRIAAAGIPLAVWARRPAQAAVVDGARVAGSLAELAAEVDVLAVCVGDDADVWEVAAAAAPHLPTDAILVVHSTIAPDTCRELAAEHGVRVVDAPVSGGRARAAAGELTVMVGGDPVDVERVRPVLDAFAGLVSHVGPLGAGQVLKLVNNLLFTAQLAVTADAVTLLRSLELDVPAAAEAIAVSTGGSRAVQMFVAGGADEVFPRHQDGRARGAALLAKDNALGRAVAGGLPPRLDDLVHEGLRLAVESGERNP
jgi:3-hydroxyisobutyrate dehydrogenase